MRIRHTNLLAMAHFLHTTAEPRLVRDVSVLLFRRVLTSDSIINLGSYRPRSQTESNRRSRTRKR